MRGCHLVLRGMPILKHCSWISAMQASAFEVVEGGAMSERNRTIQHQDSSFCNLTQTIMQIVVSTSTYSDRTLLGCVVAACPSVFGRPFEDPCACSKHPWARKKILARVRCKPGRLSLPIENILLNLQVITKDFRELFFSGRLRATDLTFIPSN